jgi:hypothetical protein
MSLVKCSGPVFRPSVLRNRACSSTPAGLVQKSSHQMAVGGQISIGPGDGPPDRAGDLVAMPAGAWK